MKAITYTRYGSPDGLKLETVAKPTPAADQVLIRIHATSLNYADAVRLSGNPFIVRLMTGALLKPKDRILGSDVAGVVEAVGANVTQFKVGDEVFGDLSAVGLGGLAEYVCAPEKALVLKPQNISFEDAAAVPMAAVTALQGIRKGNIRAGEKVLIYGASGGVGSFAVQIAKSCGTEVTAVCSTRNVETARAIGADHVVDYTREDITQSGNRYDLIIAANGTRPISDYRRILTPNGRCIVTGGGLSQIFGSMFAGIFSRGGQTITNLTAQADQDDLRYVKDLLEGGKVRSVIDRCYPLTEAADAFRYLREGHARGKIIITMLDGVS